jgi:Ser-tRNA(Ala) deacylase AlaX
VFASFSHAILTHEFHTMVHATMQMSIVIPIAAAATYLIWRFADSKSKPDDNNRRKPGPQPVPATEPVYQFDSTLRQLTTTVLSVEPLMSLPEVDRQIFGALKDAPYHIITTRASIFHPQGGGQPSDSGTMEGEKGPSSGIFVVEDVRRNQRGEQLHLGRFVHPDCAAFRRGDSVLQKIDEVKRDLNTRYHTAVCLFQSHLCNSICSWLLYTRIDVDSESPTEKIRLISGLNAGSGADLSRDT